MRPSFTQVAPLGVGGTIVILAVAWAAIHTSYALPVIALIAVDGVLLGLARWRSDSAVVPAIMHIVWNLYAIW